MSALSGGLMALTPSTNLLLLELSADSLDQLTPHMLDFDFELGHVFYEQGELVTSLYFVDSGIVSAVSLMDSGFAIEAYMVGRDGYTGSTAWLIPSRSVVRFVAQMSGSARKIDATIFRQIAETNPEIRRVMAVYDSALVRELAQSGPCGIVHKTTQRLAKWLLRAHDRAEDDTIQMTQGVLSNLLGTQRTTVNDAAQHLGKHRAVKYSRGKVKIIDRVKLEQESCECYGAGRGIYDARKTVPQPIAA